jgi:hypothetical protein
MCQRLCKGGEMKIMPLSNLEEKELLQLLLLERKQQKTTIERVNSFIDQFAELNLEIAEEIRINKDYTPELLRELRENAQVLTKLI